MAGILARDLHGCVWAVNNYNPVIVVPTVLNYHMTGASAKGWPALALWASAWPHGPYDLAKRGARPGEGAKAHF
jgi:hypothetical protein